MSQNPLPQTDPYQLRVTTRGYSEWWNGEMLPQFILTSLHPTGLTIYLLYNAPTLPRVLSYYDGMNFEDKYLLHVLTMDDESLGVFQFGNLTTTTTHHYPAATGLELTFELSRTKDLTLMQELLNRTRKQDHLAICSELWNQPEAAQATPQPPQFYKVRFAPQPIVDLDLTEIDLSTEFLGQHLQLPLMITAMTGGIDQGRLINLFLAHTAARYGIPMSVGSQKLALDQPELCSIFKLKPYCDNLCLIGNLGIDQLIQPDGAERLSRCVDMIGADAMGIHCNLLQELIQAEGHTAYSGLWDQLQQCLASSPVPVIIKEVGSGMSADTIHRLARLGASAIDVGGRGGLSWAVIESRRTHDPVAKAIGQTFREWGMSTAESLASVDASTLTIPLVATGGIRDGLMAAQALRSGAHIVGMGMPLLQAARADIAALDQDTTATLTKPDTPPDSITELLNTLPYQHLNQVLTTWTQELKIALMLTGSQNLDQLKTAPLLQHPN